MASPETFYPDAHPESTSVDACVYNNNPAGATWADLRLEGGTGVYLTDAGTDIAVAIINDPDIDKWSQIYRAIILFDTSGLPDGCTITGAVLSLYGYDKRDDVEITPDIGIYLSDPASDTEIVIGDFDALGTTAHATPIAYVDWSTVGYNDFTLIDVDTDGFGYIKKAAGVDGITKFGVRNAEYDADGDAPTWKSGATLISALYFYSADKGEGFKPKLVVTYTVPVIPISVADGNFIGVAVIKV